MTTSESIRGLIAAACAAGLLAAPATAGARVTQLTTTSVPIVVKTTQTYTGTGVRLRAGESVTVRASGRIAFRAQRGASTTPVGVEWGKKCRDIAGSASTVAWPAPGQRCWSLIGRVGSNPPFEIGAAKTFKAAKGGELFLGINDNHVGDNRGTWTAAITRVVAQPPTTGGAVPANSTSKKSNLLLPILLVAGLLVVAALLTIWVVGRRRRSKGAAAPTPPLATSRADAVVDRDAPGSTAGTETLPSPLTVPFDQTSSDVNIFEVELSRLGTLRVGYSFFPEDTVVHWRVVESGATVDTGEFAAEGGGGAKHFVKLPIAGGLAPGAAGIGVHFHWDIGEVPFDYSVRRDPGP